MSKHEQPRAAGKSETRRSCPKIRHLGDSGPLSPPRTHLIRRLPGFVTFAHRIGTPAQPVVSSPPRPSRRPPLVVVFFCRHLRRSCSTGHCHVCPSRHCSLVRDHSLSFAHSRKLTSGTLAQARRFAGAADRLALARGNIPLSPARQSCPRATLIVKPRDDSSELTTRSSTTSVTPRRSSDRKNCTTSTRSERYVAARQRRNSETHEAHRALSFPTRAHSHRRLSSGTRVRASPSPSRARLSSS